MDPPCLGYLHLQIHWNNASSKELFMGYGHPSLSSSPHTLAHKQTRARGITNRGHLYLILLSKCLWIVVVVCYIQHKQAHGLTWMSFFFPPYQFTINERLGLWLKGTSAANCTPTHFLPAIEQSGSLSAHPQGSDPWRLHWHVPASFHTGAPSAYSSDYLGETDRASLPSRSHRFLSVIPRTRH